MEARLKKWGNSFGIRIPKNILDDLKIGSNDLLELKMENDRIVISKSYKKKVSLKEIFENYDGINPVEFEWDEAVGKEIW